MASAAPAHTRCGVSECMPSGMALTVDVLMFSLLLASVDGNIQTTNDTAGIRQTWARISGVDVQSGIEASPPARVGRQHLHRPSLAVAAEKKPGLPGQGPRRPHPTGRGAGG